MSDEKKYATLTLVEDDLAFLHDLLFKDLRECEKKYSKLWHTAQYAEPSEELSALKYKVDRLTELFKYVDSCFVGMYQPAPDPNVPYPF